MISQTLIDRLPSPLRRGYLGQALWQWLGLAVMGVFGGVLLYLIWFKYRKMRRRQTGNEWPLKLIAYPLLAVGVLLAVRSISQTQLNITGVVNNFTLILLRSIFLTLLSWTVFVGCNIIMHTLIYTSRAKENLLNIDFIHLVFRVLSTILIFAIWYWGGMDFGLPVNAVFPSAGIAGVAVALAARESLANFFWGYIYPFRWPL